MVIEVVSSIGIGGTYGDWEAWEAAMPSNLPGADTLWKGEQKNQELTSTNVFGAVTIGGVTSDATRYPFATTEAGASYRDNATKNLRYDATKGAALSRTANYNHVIRTTVPFTKIHNLQLRQSGSGNGLSIAANDCEVDGVLSENKTSSAGATGATFRTVIKNSTFINDHSGTATAFYFGGGSISLYNCTFVRPSNRTVVGDAFNLRYVTAFNVQNCLVFGYSNFANMTSWTGTVTNCASSGTIPKGTSHLTSQSYTDTFEEPSSVAGAHDFRLKSTAPAVNAGVDLSASGVTVDVYMTARSGAYDIGAYEYVAAGTIYEDTIAESLGLMDSFAFGVGFGLTIADSFATTESMTASAAFGAPMVESLGLEDTLTGGVGIGLQFAEALALDDAVVGGVAVSFSVAEGLTFADAATGGFAFSDVLAESLTLADSLGVAMAMSAAMLDGFVIADESAASAVFLASVTETAGYSDSFEDGFFANRPFVTLCIQAQPNTFTVTETPDNITVADTLYAERISTVMSVRLEPNALSVAESSLTPTATEEAGGEITLNSVQASRC